MCVCVLRAMWMEPRGNVVFFTGNLILPSKLLARDNDDDNDKTQIVSSLFAENKGIR